MHDRITQAFEQIHAEEALKERTRAYLRAKRKSSTGAKNLGYLRLVPVAACLLLVVLAARWFYFTPTVEISIDINPSIELGVNRFDRVISATGYNADGQELLKTLDLENLDYNEAVEEIIHSDTITALLSGDAVLTIGVIGPDGEQTTRVLSDMEACTSHSEKMHCYHAEEGMAEDAHDAGLSCGKYRAYLQLKALDPSVTPEDVAQMTMQEIWEKVAALSGSTDETAVLQDYLSGGQHGDGQGHHEAEYGGNGNHHGWEDD